MKNKIINRIPAEVEQILLKIGGNIRKARLRRKLRLIDLAEKVGISRFLMADIENGKPSASIFAYLGALWALGLTEGLTQIGDPDRDWEGKTLESMRAAKTAPKRKKVLDDDF